MIFRAAATVDEVQRTRPITIIEWRGNPEAERKSMMRSKKHCFARVQGPKFGQ